MAGKRYLCQYTGNYVRDFEQGVYGVVSESPLIEGCREVLLDRLVVRVEGNG